VRLFVALDVPEETRRVLGEAIRAFERVGRGARWMRAQNVHVTLKFIGQIDDSKLPAIQNRLAEVHASGPMAISFRRFGFFPNERHPHVLWAGIESGANLAALAGTIASSLEPLGIPREARPFQPHLTLARFKTQEGLPKLYEIVAAFPQQEFGTMMATEFHLYQSELKPAGAVHTKLASFRFAESAMP